MEIDVGGGDRGLNVEFQVFNSVSV